MKHDGAYRLVAASEKMRLLAKENPCGWGDAVLGAVADSINLMLGEKTKNGVTLMELSEYYHTTIRTIQRWRNEYDDFPQPIDPYAKTLSFPTDDVVEWKQRHSDRF